MKRCPRCGEEKPDTAFGIRRPNTKKSYLRAYCQPCYRLVYREHYEKHKNLYIQRAERFHAEIRELIFSAKTKPCTDCGRCFPYYQMDFDHRDGEEKCFNIADVLGPRRVGKKRLLAGMAKCDLVCGYCHRERTHQRRLRAKSRRKELAEQGIMLP